MLNLNKYTLLLVALFLFNQSVFAQTNYYEDALRAYKNKDVNTAYIHLKNALQQDPKNLPVKLLLAEVLIDQHKYPLAEIELNDAIAQGVDFNLIITPLGDSLLFQYKYDEALVFADRKNLNKRGQLSYSLIKARAYQGKEQSSEALAEYQQVLASYPSNVEAMLGVVSVYIFSEKKEEVLPLLTKVELLDANNYKLWQLKGLYLQETGALIDAVLAFEKANQLEPDNLATYRMMSNIYMQLQDVKKTNEILDKILTISPNDPQAQLMHSSMLRELGDDILADNALMELTNQLSSYDASFIQSQPQLLLIDGMTSYAQQNWEQARNKFLTYLKEKEDDIDAIILLADIYIKMNEHNKALKLLSAHEKKLITNKDYALILAGLYLQFDQKFRADYLLAKLREIYINDEAILILSAELLSEIDRLEQALTLLEDSGIKGKPNFTHTLAILYYRLKKFDKSLAQVSTLIELAPENVEYRLLKANVLIELGKFTDAENIIVTLYESKPNDKAVQKSYALLQASLGEKTTARKILNELVTAYPDDISNWLILADIEYELGNVDDAIAMLKRHAKSATHKEQVNQKLALFYFKQKQFEDSLAVIVRLLKEDRLNSKTLTLKAKNLIALGQNEQAKRQLNILKGLWTDDAFNLMQLNGLQQQVNDYQGAEYSLSMAQKLRPNTLAIIIETIKLKIRINKLDEASQLIKSAEKLSQKNNTTLMILKGDVSLAKNKRENAFSYYFQVLKQDDENVVALIKLNQISNNKSLSDKFVAHVELLIEQNPERSFQRNILADHLIYHKKFDQAKHHYQVLLTKDIPLAKRGLILNNLATLYIRDKDYKTAVDFSQKALKILGSVPAIIDTLGWSLTLSGEPDKGLSYLRQAFSMSSSSPDIQYHIAYSLIKLDRKQEAKELLQKLVVLSNNFEEYPLAIQLLEDLNKS